MFWKIKKEIKKKYLFINERILLSLLFRKLRMKLREECFSTDESLLLL
jgi:hypothetical protein